jgi:hypothetical protein
MNDKRGGRSIRSVTNRRTLKRHAIEPDRVMRFEARMARLADVRRREQSAKRWCILRTSSRGTVALLDDLARAGFDVWTPTQVIEKRVGRNGVRVERCMAMMPSFLFAAEDDAANLLRLSLDPMKRCTDFSVFHYRERVPLIADRDLLAVRDMEISALTARDEMKTAREQALERKRLADEARNERERRALLRKYVPSLPIGQAVLMPEGAWSGTSGIVVKSERGITTVNMGGVFDIKIDTFLLSTGILEPALP